MIPSSTRIFVCTERQDMRRLAAIGAARERDDGFQCPVLIGSAALEPEMLERAGRSIPPARGRLAQMHGLHAKVLVADERAVVSSYNFLSADALGTAGRSREIGIAIDGEEPANEIWKRFDMVRSE